MRSARTLAALLGSARVMARLAAASTWVLFITTIASHSYAASLERLGDGRIALKALGERLVFREQDAEFIGVYWPSYPCKPRPERGVTLAQWLNDPAIAACLNAAIPDELMPGQNKSMVLKVYLAYADGVRYPGPGKRIDQPLGDVPPLYPGGISVQELPSPPRLLGGEVFVSVGPPDMATQCYQPPRVAPDELGYREIRSRNPSGIGFYLAERSRPDNASRPLCIGCSRINTWGCGIKVMSEDRVAFTSIEWFEGNQVTPRAAWTAYDQIARKIAQSIFVDRPQGDFQ